MWFADGSVNGVSSKREECTARMIRLLLPNREMTEDDSSAQVKVLCVIIRKECHSTGLSTLYTRVLFECVCYEGARAYNV